MIIFILSLYAGDHPPSASRESHRRSSRNGVGRGNDSRFVLTRPVTLRPHFMNIFHSDSYCLTLAINLDFGPRATVGRGMSAPLRGNLSWWVCKMWPGRVHDIWTGWACWRTAGEWSPGCHNTNESLIVSKHVFLAPEEENQDVLVNSLLVSRLIEI